MSILNEQAQSFSIHDEYFQGPSPYMISARINGGEGDTIRGQPPSQNSITVPDQHKLVDLSYSSIKPIQLELNKSMRMRKSEYQSAYVDEDMESGGKPQFLKLIIAKSFQNSFINNLWNRSYLRKLHQLSTYQIQALDDLQLESDTYLENPQSQLSTWQAMKKYLTYIDVFTPYSKLFYTWELFQILTYILIFFWLPYKISFNQDSLGELLGYSPDNQILEIIFLSTLSFDVIIGLNLAFIHKGQIVKDRKRIVANYFKQFAFVDLVSLSTVTLQFFILSNTDQSYQMLTVQTALCAVFYILRTTKINKIQAQIQEFLNLDASLNDLVGLVKLLMVIIFIAHICGCVWHGIAFYNAGYTWLDAYHFRDKDNASKYNASIYWATMTMTTVGYGDITATNNAELLISNLTMFIASVVFPYSVNSIGIFVSNMYNSTMEQSRSITLMNTFMAKNKIQFELQTRVRNYLDYIWQEESNSNDDKIASLMGKLSSNLQDELQFQLRVNILQNCKVMVKTFSQKMIKQLLGQMEEQNFSPEDRVVTINTFDDGALYIIAKGEIEIIFEGINTMNERIKRNSLRFLFQGDYFGEFAFFTGQMRTATAISRAFTKVFKITRENFIKTLQSYPNDYEKYCQLSHNLLNQEFADLMVNCYSCSSNRHLVNSCNYLHFCSDKEALIKKELYPCDQKRTNFQLRAREKQISPWCIQKYIASKAKEFTAEYYYQNSRVTENEEIDQHSNLVNEAYEDELDIEVPSSLNQRSMSRTFSKVSSKPQQVQTLENEDQEYDQKGYSRRALNPKGTMQTAGFGGGMRNSMKADIMKDFIDQESSDEESEEDKDQVVLNLPVPQKGPSEVNRTQQQKITFTRQSSSEEIIPRQQSARSHTYTQKQNPSQTIKRTLTPEKIIPPGSDIDIQNQSRHSLVRRSTKKQSVATRTLTRVQGREMTGVDNQNPTSIFLDNQTQHTNNNYIFMQFDKMHLFIHYFPLNNFDVIIKRYQRAQKFFGKKRLYPEQSLYSFFFMTIKKGWKLRKLGSKLSTRFAESLKKPYTKTFQSFKTVRKVNQTTGNGGVDRTSPLRLQSFK